MRPSYQVPFLLYFLFKYLLFHRKILHPFRPLNPSAPPLQLAIRPYQVPLIFRQPGLIRQRSLSALQLGLIGQGSPSQPSSDSAFSPPYNQASSGSAPLPRPHQAALPLCFTTRPHRAALSLFLTTRLHRAVLSFQGLIRQYSPSNLSYNQALLGSAFFLPYN